MDQLAKVSKQCNEECCQPGQGVGPLWATFPDNIRNRSFLLGNIGTRIILLCLSLQYTTMSTMKLTSLVWDYFTEKGDWVTCTKCPKSYKLATAKSSTHPLRYHLKTNHSVDLDKILINFLFKHIICLLILLYICILL